MSVLTNFTNPPAIGVDSSKGNYGISYKYIFSKVGQILNSDNPIMVSHIKASRLLYIVHNIRVLDNKFQIIPLGGIDLMVVHDKMIQEHAGMIIDVAQLGDRDMVFVFKDNITSEYLSTADRFTGLYFLFNALVAISVKPSLCICYDNTYPTIARYAPYVLAVKSILQMGINLKIEDIDFSSLPDDDAKFINETTLDIVKNSTEEDLLSYGVLCEFAR